MIGSQAPRRHHFVELDAFLTAASSLAKKHNSTLADVIAAKDALEIERANYIAIDDGDNRDEHASGYYEALGSIAGKIANIDKTLEMM